MRDVYLHGELGQKYGEVFQLDVQTASEAVSALCANFKGFASDICQSNWHLVRGQSVETGLDLDLDQATSLRLGKGALHIVPEMVGSKNGGVLKVVLGVALIGLTMGFGTVGVLATAIAPSLGVATTWGAAMGSMGLGMALAGISSMLAPEQSFDAEEQDRSDMFSSLVPVAREGSGIPVGYGNVVSAGMLISVDLDIIEEDIAEDVVADADTTSAIEKYHSGNHADIR